MEIKGEFKQAKEGTIAKHRKEKGFYREANLLAIVNGSIKNLICVRWYFVGKDGMSPLHCCVWVRSPSYYFSGAGKASGCGYHKPSAALYSALESIGIEVSGLAGCGDSAIEEALKLIAEKMGFADCELYVHWAHA